MVGTDFVAGTGFVAGTCFGGGCIGFGVIKDVGTGFLFSGNSGGF